MNNPLDEFEKQLARCQRKRYRFKKLKEAQSRLTTIQKKDFKVRLRIYLCPVCKFYHLTSQV